MSNPTTATSQDSKNSQDHEVDAPEQSADDRRDAWRKLYQPANFDEEWLVDQMVLASFHLEDCHQQEATLRAGLAWRARLCWAEDRRAEVEEIGARLHREPTKTVARLQSSRHGCEWLLIRWKGLLRALGDDPANPRAWTQAQRALAHDLAGTPPPFRVESPWEWAGRDSARALVEAEINRLETLLRRSLEPADRIEQSQAAEGVAPPAHPDLVRVRRERDGWRRQLSWARSQLVQGRKAAEQSAAASRRDASATAPRVERDDHGDLGPRAERDFNHDEEGTTPRRQPAAQSLDHRAQNRARDSSNHHALDARWSPPSRNGHAAVATAAQARENPGPPPSTGRAGAISRDGPALSRY